MEADGKRNLKWRKGFNMKGKGWSGNGWKSGIEGKGKWMRKKVDEGKDRRRIEKDREGQRIKKVKKRVEGWSVQVDRVEKKQNNEKNKR